MRTTSKQKSGVRKGFLIIRALQWRRRWWIRSRWASSVFISHKRSRMCVVAEVEKLGEYWMAFVDFMEFWIMISSIRFKHYPFLERSDPSSISVIVALHIVQGSPWHDGNECEAPNLKRGLLQSFLDPGKGRELPEMTRIATCFREHSTPAQDFKRTIGSTSWFSGIPGFWNAAIVRQDSRFSWKIKNGAILWGTGSTSGAISIKMTWFHMSW